MTQPGPSPVLTDEQLSGRAADAIADLHGELRRRYSGLNTAEAQLAEVLLTAQAASETGRIRLQDIQRQLIEAISNPVNALDTPAGERQFLLFLRAKIAEIQRIVDDGALTAQDQAELAQALGSGYLDEPLLDAPPPRTPAAIAPTQSTQAAAPAGISAMPAMGGLPQAATPSAMSPSGLGSAASPLAGLASLLGGLSGDESPTAPSTPAEELDRDVARHDDEEKPEPEPEDQSVEAETPAEPEDAPTEGTGPAETRPASM